MWVFHRQNGLGRTRRALLAYDGLAARRNDRAFKNYGENTVREHRY
jgi:hypothetical protein